MICKSSYELFRNLRDLREDSHNCQNWKTIVKIVELFLILLKLLGPQRHHSVFVFVKRFHFISHFVWVALNQDGSVKLNTVSH